MKRALLLCCGGIVLIAVSAFVVTISRTKAATTEPNTDYSLPVVYDGGFDVQILVNGRPLDEYEARGTTYVEAIAGAEYEVRIRNPLPYRVAVALSVDGLNSIDARHTTAWNSSKWVIEPYGTISVSGWQMSSERARQFYFTSERDSYGAKLGQTANLGLVSAVFFRERRPYPVPVAPPPGPRPRYEEDSREKSSEAPMAGRDSSVDRSASAQGSGDTASTRKGQIAPQPDDEYAATGIGRSVENDVRWVNMELESRPVGQVTIRYEYYSALVRLGVMPRPYYPRPDPLRRRERATGFEDRRFSPEP